MLETLSNPLAKAIAPAQVRISTPNAQAARLSRNAATGRGSTVMAPPGRDEERKERSDWSDEEGPGVEGAMTRCAGGAAIGRSLGHHLSHRHSYGACWNPAGVGVTVCVGRRWRACMTPPPPVLAGLRTGNREMRRRA